jgi:hypothetical protein
MLGPVEGTVAFSETQIISDITTPLGPIEGTVTLTNGQLIGDLTTPFGSVDGSINLGQFGQFLSGIYST